MVVGPGGRAAALLSSNARVLAMTWALHQAVTHLVEWTVMAILACLRSFFGGRTEISPLFMHLLALGPLGCDLPSWTIPGHASRHASARRSWSTSSVSGRPEHASHPTARLRAVSEGVRASAPAPQRLAEPAADADLRVQAVHLLQRHHLSTLELGTRLDPSLVPRRVLRPVASATL